ncbi:MAG: cytochrome-c oxidase, cbb3-type subunit II, partial [Myxococcota bacterium]
AHFWIGTVGILFYIVAMYTSGVTQGLMWRAFDETGRLAYPDFLETVLRLMPMYYVRAFGGALYVIGVVLLLINYVMTWRTRPRQYEPSTDSAPALSAAYNGPAPQAMFPSDRGNVLGFYWMVKYFTRAEWHRVWERKPIKFAVWTTVAVATASLFEIIPTFLIRSNVPTIASVKPYTPLELYGRDLYIAEGCYNCHSQMIRPIRMETERYGEYSKPGEFVYERPFLWGSRRIGPDLHRIGGKYPHLWHVRHMDNPRSTTPGSIMPPYPWMLKDDINFASIQPRVDAMAMLGVPYGEAIRKGEAMARAQADSIAEEILAQGGPDVRGKDIVAMTAYLQRLGTDISKSPESAGEEPVATK